MLSTSISIPINFQFEVRVAAQQARQVAQSLGFTQTIVEEITLVVTELAANQVRYGRNGVITISPISDNEQPGIQIEAHDTGPGIPDIEMALTDGFSTSGGLGFGLGTANRLMDEFLIQSCEDQKNGTHILCKRFMRSEIPVSSVIPIEFGIATRPHPNMTVNGDAFVIKLWGTNALVGIIDGLGHGENAMHAAQAARQYIETHYDQSFKSIFLGVERNCHATRGVVMALGRFKWDEQSSQIMLTFASIGNIEVRIFGNKQSINLGMRRGILGSNAPNPIVTETPWAISNTMVLHSDGISTRWSWSDFSDLFSLSAEEIARNLLMHLAKDQDDATVIVVRNTTKKGKPNEQVF